MVYPNGQARQLKLSILEFQVGDGAAGKLHRRSTRNAAGLFALPDRKDCFNFQQSRDQCGGLVHSNASISAG